MAIQDFVTGQVLTSTQMDNLQANDYNQTVSAKVASYVLVAADKGTRVTMSNAGATTITVNTALFAAGDTLFITNIGAGACTITAGTATVSTASSLVLAQYDSGRLYFTSTGVAIWEKYQGAAAAGGVTFSGASVYKAAGQVISGTTFTTLLFDTENYDTDTYHNTGSNTGRLTIPAAKTGYYKVNLTWGMVMGLAIIKMLKNGSAIGYGTYSGYVATVSGTGSTPAVFTLSIDLYLTAADYIEVQLYDTVGNTTQQQLFSIQYLGA